MDFDRVIEDNTNVPIPDKRLVVYNLFYSTFETACRKMGAMEGHEMAWAIKLLEEMYKTKTGVSSDKEY